jgi:D-alanyl-lipoteichoic acid acyltransferase DltB (MBOAT superfamily)
MIFNSFQFILIYPFLFLLYYAIPASWKTARNVFLLVLSYALYICWKPVYALILLAVTLSTYYTARMLKDSRHRKRVIVTSTLLSLSPLLFFKYFNFINDSIAKALMHFGIDCHLPGLNWAVPIGISFFTFQALGYLFDVYYRKIEEERNFLTYALFVSFFPSIVSGPINKASSLIPQIRNLRPYFDYPKAVEGMKMLLWGMFMKVVIADRAAIYVNFILNNYSSNNGTTCALALLLYTFQIYTDFAGYSLMAIGVGKTLGFELTENFRRPYFSYSVTDFWRRWHISLSTWLKDYVYIPLGGSRCSKPRNYFNIIVTFLVSGIWHGANWTYVVWGLLHGLAQVVEKMLGQQKCNYGPFGKGVKILITFLFINFSWIFFRMPTLSDAWELTLKIFDFSQPLGLKVDIPSVSFSLFAITLLIIKEVADEFTNIRAFNSRHVTVRWATYAIVLSSILLAGVFGADQFIYANF